jgi:hypothetical protein
VRLATLYTIRFFYPQGWSVAVTGPQGTEQRDFYPAEGRCEGRVRGMFRGANHPRRRPDETYEMDLQGFIETEDGATIMIDYQGYGRSRRRSDELYAAASMTSEVTARRRQVVGFARHLTDSPSYHWLNDAVCAIAGEVRPPVGVPPDQIRQADVRLVFDVAELLWDAPPE